MFPSRKAEGCRRQGNDPQGHRGLAEDRMAPGKGPHGDLGEGTRATHCPEASRESRHQELSEEMGTGLGWMLRKEARVSAGQGGSRWGMGDGVFLNTRHEKGDKPVKCVSWWEQVRGERMWQSERQCGPESRQDG